MTTQPISIIAADLPLSRLPITGRRACDDAISRGFGRQLCSSHTPSAIRPGPISDDYRNTLGNLGFPLVTAGSAAPAQQLIEVYPHPAILTLLGAHNRLQYKVSRTLRYWPQLRCLTRPDGGYSSVPDDPPKRSANSHRERSCAIPNPNPPGTIAGLKGVEDALDALVCAWVGSQHLVGGTQFLVTQTLRSGFLDLRLGSATGQNDYKFELGERPTRT